MKQQTVVRSRQLSKWWCWSWNKSSSLSASCVSALPASSASSRCWARILLCINALHDCVFTVWIRANRAFYNERRTPYIVQPLILKTASIVCCRKLFQRKKNRRIKIGPVK